MDAQKVKQSTMMEYGIVINAITICVQNVWNDCQQPNIFLDHSRRIQKQ